MEKENHKRGFTLVELSIVLVIIGLLIGGILVAQSMISANQVVATVRQFQQFDIAYSNFKTTYKQIPGDSTLLENDSANNNGTVEGINEYRYYWRQLSLGQGLKNYMKQDYAAFAADMSDISEASCPKLILPTISPWALAKCLTVRTNGWVVGNYTVELLYHYGDGSVPYRPSDAAAIDAKMDDGRPKTGNFRAWNDDGLTDSPCINASDGYDTEFSDSNFGGCSLYVKVGNSNGSEQN